MANYIKSLEEKVELATFWAEEFQRHLSLPKFSGTENGERKDWIATQDVHNRLNQLLSMLREKR